MYQLSIDHQGRSVTTTDHPDRDDAHRSLINYVIGADYYLRPLPTHPDTTRYELLALAEPDSRAAMDHRPPRHLAPRSRHRPRSALPAGGPHRRPRRRPLLVHRWHTLARSRTAGRSRAAHRTRSACPGDTAPPRPEPGRYPPQPRRAGRRRARRFAHRHHHRPGCRDRCHR